MINTIWCQLPGCHISMFIYVMSGKYFNAILDQLCISDKTLVALWLCFWITLLTVTLCVYSSETATREFNNKTRVSLLKRILLSPSTEINLERPCWTTFPKTERQSPKFGNETVKPSSQAFPARSNPTVSSDVTGKDSPRTPNKYCQIQYVGLNRQIVSTSAYSWKFLMGRVSSCKHQRKRNLRFLEDQRTKI